MGILGAEVADQGRGDLRTLVSGAPQGFLEFSESAEGDRAYRGVLVGERVPQQEVADARIGDLGKPPGHRDPAGRIAVRPAGEEQEEPLLVLGVEGPHGSGAHLGIGRLHPPDQRVRDLGVPHLAESAKRLPADRGNRIVERLDEPRSGCGAHRQAGLPERLDDADRFDPDGVARVAEFGGDVLGHRQPRGAEPANAERPDDRIRRAGIGAMQGHEFRIPETGRGPCRNPPERSRGTAASEDSAGVLRVAPVVPDAGQGEESEPRFVPGRPPPERLDVLAPVGVAGRFHQFGKPARDDLAGAFASPPPDGLDRLLANPARAVLKRRLECGDRLCRQRIFNDAQGEGRGRANGSRFVGGESGDQRFDGFGPADASEGEHRPAPHLGVRIEDPVPEPPVPEGPRVFEREDACKPLGSGKDRWARQLPDAGAALQRRRLRGDRCRREKKARACEQNPRAGSRPRNPAGQRESVVSQRVWRRMTSSRSAKPIPAPSGIGSEPSGSTVTGGSMISSVK